jgi:hypothetical protein
LITADPAAKSFGFYSKTFSFVWENFWSSVFALFQPQFLAMYFIHEHPQPVPAITHEFHILPIIIFTGLLISIPVWSFCFSWVFIHGKDWLNHFPVLGKKVF